LISWGPQRGNIGEEFGHRRIERTRGGGEQSHLQFEVADIGVRMINDGELDGQLTGALFREAESGELQKLGQGCFEETTEVVIWGAPGCLVCA